MVHFICTEEIHSFLSISTFFLNIFCIFSTFYIKHRPKIKKIKLGLEKSKAIVYHDSNRNEVNGS